MGRDKATLQLGSRDLLEGAIAAVTPWVSEVLLACGDAPRYEDRGLRLVIDHVRGGGPLLGLRAGLASARTDWVLLLACDMPLAEQAIADLVTAARPEDQLVHHTVRDLPEPTCALYHRSVLKELDAALARGERRMTSFWPHVEVRSVVGAPDEAFENVNTPRDLARARACEVR